MPFGRRNYSNLSVHDALQNVRTAPWMEMYQRRRSRLVRAVLDNDGKVVFEIGGTPKGSADPVARAAHRFRTPAEAEEFIARTGYKTSEYILPGNNLARFSERYKHGPYTYHELYNVSRRLNQGLAPGQKPITIVRESFDVRPGGIASVMENVFGFTGTSTDIMKGVWIPDDENLNLIRMFQGDQELSTDQIYAMMRGAGLSFTTADTKGVNKLVKRLKVLINQEGFSVHLPSRPDIYDKSGKFKIKPKQTEAAIRAIVVPDQVMLSAFDPESSQALQRAGWLRGKSSKEIADVIERQGSGITIASPRFIQDFAGAMKQEAQRVLNDIDAAIKDPKLRGQLSQLDLLKLRKSAEKAMTYSDELQVIASQGGRLQDFRLSGFDRNFLRDTAQRLGITDPSKIESFIKGMVKGDVIVPGLKRKGSSGWAEVQKRVAEFLRTEGGLDADEAFIRAAGMDVLVPTSSFTSEFGTPGVARVSAKPVHPKALTRTNQQFNMALPNLLLGDSADQTFEDLVEFNVSAVRQKADALAGATRFEDLPKSMQEEIMRMARYDQGSLIDIANEVLGSIGSSELSERMAAFEMEPLVRARAFASQIMDQVGSAQPIDPDLFRMLGATYVEALSKAGKWREQLSLPIHYGFASHAITGSVGAIAGYEPPKLGMIGFSEAHGIQFNTADMIANLFKSAGGADLDDLFSILLRKDEQGAIRAIMLRSPMGFSEWAVRDVTAEGLRNIFKFWRREVPEYYKELAGLDDAALDVMDENALLNFARQILPQIDNKRLQVLEEYGYGRPSAKVERHPAKYGSDSMLQFWDTKTPPKSDDWAELFQPGERIKAEQEALDASATMVKRMITDMMPVTPHGQPVVSLNSLEVADIETFLRARGQDPSGEVWRKTMVLARAMRNEESRYALGRYSLAREAADLSFWQLTMDGSQRSKRALFRPFEEETIIDVLTQGVVSKGGQLNLTDIEIRRRSLLVGILRNAIENEVKIDPTLITERLSSQEKELRELLGALRDNEKYQEYLRGLGIDIDKTPLPERLEDLFLDLSKPEELEKAWYTRTRRAQAKAVEEGELILSDMEKTMGSRFTAYRSALVTQEDRANAEIMKGIYDRVMTWQNLENLPLSLEEQLQLASGNEDMLYDVADTMTRDAERVRSKYAGREVRRFLASLIGEEDDAVFNKDARGALTAFMQMYEDTNTSMVRSVTSSGAQFGAQIVRAHAELRRLQHAVGADDLSDPRVRADARLRIAQNRGATAAESMDEDFLKYLEDTAAGKVLGPEPLQRRIFAIDLGGPSILPAGEMPDPGTAARMMHEGGVDVANLIAKGELAKGPQIGLADTFGRLKNLWKIPGVKLGSGIVAGLILASTIYTRASDRTPEDMAGPQFLPGGSAYEQYSGQDYTSAFLDDFAPPSQAVGGVTYRIYTHSNRDPDLLRRQAELITGASAKQHVYKARSRPKTDYSDIIMRNF